MRRSGFGFGFGPQPQFLAVGCGWVPVMDMASGMTLAFLLASPFWKCVGNI